MMIGKIISFFRNRKGMMRKFLSVKVDFLEKAADIHLTQYDSVIRKPKSDLTEVLSEDLGMSTMVLNMSDTDTNIRFMHTFFALEDIYSLKIDKLDDEICTCLYKNSEISYISFLEHFTSWQKETEKYFSGEISKEQNELWRYTYTEVKVQYASESLAHCVKTIKDNLKWKNYIYM